MAKDVAVNTTVTLVIDGIEIKLTLKQAEALHEKLGEVVDRKVTVREYVDLYPWYPRYPYVTYSTTLGAGSITTNTLDWQVAQSPTEGVNEYRIVC